MSSSPGQVSRLNLTKVVSENKTRFCQFAWSHLLLDLAAFLVPAGGSVQVMAFGFLCSTAYRLCLALFGSTLFI